MNQTVDTGGWRALEESHKAAHAEAKQVPLTLLNERQSAIAQAFREMARGVRACTQAEASQA